MNSRFSKKEKKDATCVCTQLRLVFSFSFCQIVTMCNVANVQDNSICTKLHTQCELQISFQRDLPSCDRQKEKQSEVVSLLLQPRHNNMQAQRMYNMHSSNHPWCLQQTELNSSECHWHTFYHNLLITNSPSTATKREAGYTWQGQSGINRLKTPNHINVHVHVGALAGWQELRTTRHRESLHASPSPQPLNGEQSLKS